MAQNLVFLGGTCGNNPWRDAFIGDLAARGVDRNVFFDPVVPDWNEAAQRREEEAITQANYLVFYLADPRQDGNPLSAYSIVEAVMALYDAPATTVVVFDTGGMEGHPLKAMVQTRKVLKQRFPSANIFDTPEAAKDWLAAQLAGEPRSD